MRRFHSDSSDHREDVAGAWVSFKDAENLRCCLKKIIESAEEVKGLWDEDGDLIFHQSFPSLQHEMVMLGFAIEDAERICGSALND